MILLVKEQMEQVLPVKVLKVKGNSVLVQ